MSEDENQGKDRIIDLSAKKTEDEWAYSAQAFFEKITPLWFKWLGWVFATGGVAYLAKKTGSIPLKIIETVSYLILALYFLYFFASFRVEPYHSWASSRSSKLKKFLALLPVIGLSLALVLGARVLISHIIEQIQIAK